MKTTFNLVTILYQALTGSDLEEAITGSLYTRNRPDGSTLEDVVVNGITVNTAQIQLGTGNVNIHVPDIQVNVLGKTQFWPDTARLAELTALATSILAESIQADYDFELSTLSDAIAEPESKSHYVNLRVDFKFYPITT